MDVQLLNNIHSPADLRALDREQLPALCDEIRAVILDRVSQNGGHLAPNLGVVELTVALHRTFDCPKDAIVWDVGHQCYTHKLLTGRYDQFDTLRQQGGISGFPDPRESEYDAFIAGHSSTAVSVAAGLARANTLKGDDHTVVAVIGDGALTGGMAYEGLSNAGQSNDRLIVVLNDNHMSISKNVGFVARHLANLRARSGYVKFKHGLTRVLHKIPLIGKPIYRFLLRAKQRMKYALYDSSTMFEDMGFYYIGPIDGHNLRDLTMAMESAKQIEQPVLLHVDTVKGKGYGPAVQNPDTFHGIGKFDVETGKPASSGNSFSKTFGETMVELAEEHDDVVAITAAMKGGTGLSAFAEKFPDRFMDVGIAEEHAVTTASAMATKGIVPVFAVYSTFLQRCFDQLVNDTAILNNHIVLAIDRAGIVPDDGVTHQGIFDVAMLNAVPNMTVYAPSTLAELPLCLKQAIYGTSGPVAVRYPKGNELPCDVEYTPDGHLYTLFTPDGKKPETLFVTYGRIFSSVMNAAKRLNENGVPVSVLKLTRIKPLPKGVISEALGYRRVHFFEEAELAGGVGEFFGSRLVQRGFAREYEIHAVKGFVPTCKTDWGLAQVGLDTDGICRAVAGQTFAPEETDE